MLFRSTCRATTSVVLAANVAVADIIATPATEPAPKVATVTTVAVTTAAATATTATSFFAHEGHSPFSSCKLTGLFTQYAKRFADAVDTEESVVYSGRSALINRCSTGS